MSPNAKQNLTCVRSACLAVTSARERKCRASADAPINCGRSEQSTVNVLATREEFFDSEASSTCRISCALLTPRDARRARGMQRQGQTPSIVDRPLPKVRAASLFPAASSNLPVR